MSVDPEAVMTEAIRQATAVMEAVFTGMEAPAVSQDQLREAFEVVTSSELGVQVFVDEFGMEEAVKQGALALARVRAERRRST